MLKIAVWRENRLLLSSYISSVFLYEKHFVMIARKILQEPIIVVRNHVPDNGIEVNRKGFEKEIVIAVKTHECISIYFHCIIENTLENLILQWMVF